MRTIIFTGIALGLAYWLQTNNGIYTLPSEFALVGGVIVAIYLFFLYVVGSIISGIFRWSKKQ